MDITYNTNQSSLLSTANHNIIKLLCFFLGFCSVLLSTIHIDIFYYQHDVPKWLLFELCAYFLILTLLFQKKPIKLQKRGMLIMVLILNMAISVLWAPNQYAAIELTLRFFLAVCTIYCLVELLDSDTLLNFTLECIFFSALAFSAVFIAQRYVLAMPFNNGTFSPLGFTNNAGQVFNIWIPLLIVYCYLNRKTLYKLIAGFCVLIILVHVLMEAGTRGTILGLTLSELCVFLFMLRKNKKQALVFFTLTALLTLGLATYHLSEPLRKSRVVSQINALKMGISGREKIFSNTLDMSIDNPLGVGTNNFEYVHPKYARPGTSNASNFVNEKQILRTPHNIILKMYSELGYLGGTLFTLLMLHFFFCALKQAYQGNYIDRWLFIALSATFFHALFSAVFLTPGSLFFSCLLAALLIQRAGLYTRAFVTLPSKLTLPPIIIFGLLFSSLNILSSYYSYKGFRTYNVDALNQALIYNPDNERALFDLANVYFKKHQDLHKSLATLQQLHSVNPYHIAGLMMLAERYFQLKQYRQAQNILDKLLNFYPSFERARKLQRATQRKLKLVR